MVAYIRGNLAVDERKMTRRNSVQEQRRTVTRKKSVIPPQEKTLYLVTLLVFVIVAVVVANRYVQIYQINTEINKKEKELKQKDDDYSKLRTRITGLGGIDQMQKVGEENGMHLASDDQIIIHKSQDVSMTASQTADAR